MNLQWSSNINLSAYHTAWCVTHFPSHVVNVAEELKRTATDLDQFLCAAHIPRERFWDQLLTLSVTVEYSHALTERISSRLGISSAIHRARLAGLLNACRRSFEQTYPQYQSEIALRTGPLRQMWDGHGAGLLRMISKLTGTQLTVEHAQIVLVQPILGGMGYAHLATNRIHFEALLTHVDPALPETLRMAWLLSQLDLERPVYSELINAHRLRSVAGLAMLPVVLQAGEELELCHFSPQLLTQAIALWRVDTQPHLEDRASAIVATWWETYQASRPAWKIALSGLDHMLNPSS